MKVLTFSHILSRPGGLRTLSGAITDGENNPKRDGSLSLYAPQRSHGFPAFVL